ncbi:RHS repeat-associated protein [Streptomyces sp. V4I23]|uniref:golvesin C-terminal-like domain-containing protein n=1 Tax=Streptomyces sp. V4I23 TaxID=3042282 RepID=UPI00277F66CA|nr:DNRLRE domain-containing protein [Streptomyces sp. V4I23]MDQ1006442.1 RHS repeat-associated protein [Streptomyces sp. V4I23]
MHGRRARRWLIVSSVVALAATGVPQPAFAAPPPGDEPGLVEGFRNLLGLDEDDTEAAEPPALPDTGVPRNDRLPKGRNAAPAKRIKELEDRRTPNARYWQLSDGRVQSEVSAVPTHYRAGKDWKAVDTAVRAAGREGFTHANTTNVARTYFGERPGELVRFELDKGHWVAIGVKGAAAGRLTPEVDGSTVTYKDALGRGTDLAYTVGNGTVKEDIVLGGAPSAAPAYEFTLTTHGLTAERRGNGSIALHSESSGPTRPELVIPAPFMTDAKKDPQAAYGTASSDRVEQRLTGGDGSYTLTLRPDAAWLKAPERRYPVVVDPTISIAPTSTQSQDVMISSDGPASNYDGNWRLSVGNTSTGSSRALLKFPLGAVPAGTRLDSADLRLYYDQTHTTGDTEVQLEAHRATAAWDETTATWNNASGITGELSGTSVLVDDGDSGTTAAKGAWPASGNTAYTQYAVNKDYLYNKDAVAGDTYTWQPNLPEDGDYQVEAHYVPASDRAANAPYTVTYNGGSKTYTVDQRAGSGGRWTTLGTHLFKAGTAGKVVLGDGPASTSTAVLADALRFTKGGVVTKKPGTSNTWHSFSVTKTVQSWINGTNTNHGFVVKAGDESANGPRGGPRYEAAEYAYKGEVANYPKLVLTWGRPGVTLDAPEVIRATGAELKWSAYQDQDPVATGDDIVEYQVHRSVFQTFKPSSQTLVAPVPAGTTTFADTTATPTPADSADSFGNVFYYMVAVKTRDGEIIPAPTQIVRLPKAGRTTVVLQGSAADTTLSSAQAGTGHDTVADGGIAHPWLSVGNNSGTYGTTRALLKFPALSQVPTTSRVLEAQLDLWGTTTTTGSAGAVYELHALNRDFDESTASWNNATATTPWTAPGGDIDTAVADTVSTVTNDPARQSWYVTSLAQSWVTTPAANKGVAVKLKDESTAGPQERTIFLSSEAEEPQLRPQLVVTYIDKSTDSTYFAPDTPARMIPGDQYTVDVTLTNTTTGTWKAADQVLSYTWSLPDGTDATTGGNQLRTALPEDVLPGETITVKAALKAPINSDSGNKRLEYVLKWDLLNQTAGTWLSATESIPALTQNVRVEDPTSDQLGLEKFYAYTGKNTGAGSSLMNNLYAGNTVWQYNAFTNPGRGLATFARFAYNSQDTSDTVLGHGWSAQAAMPLRLGAALDFHPNPNPREVTLPDGDGTAHIFRKQDDGTWKAPAGVHYLLRQGAGADCTPNKDGDPQAWSLTRPDRTQFFFDCDGYLTSVTDKNGNTQTYIYEERKSNNKPVKFLRYITDPAGRQTLTVDYWTKADTSSPKIIDHVRSMTDVSGRKLTFDYSDKGLLTKLTDGAGSAQPKVFAFAYDATQGNKNVKLVKVTDPRGNATSLDYYYPNEGDDPKFHWNTQTITDRLGGTTGFVYTDPDGTAGSFIETKVTDAENHTTTQSIDGYGRVNRITNAKAETTKFAWDADNNVTRLEEANGAVTTWSYDPKTGYPLEHKDAEANKNGTAGRTFVYATGLDGHIADLFQKKSPEGRTWQFGYDALGNLTSTTDPKGVATPTAGDYTSTSQYDAYGQVTRSTDANGHATVYSGFGPTGYPSTITDPLTNPSTFDYDARGNVLKVINAKGAQVTQSYDTFGRPLEKKEPKDQAAGVFITTPAPVYDANDNITRATGPNGTATTSVFDEADQLTESTAPGDLTTDPVRRTTTTYDKVGNVLTVTDPKGNATATAGDYTTTTAYDAIYQPVRVTDAAGGTVTSEYDKVGNLTRLVDPRKNETADATDYTSLFEYDLNHRVVRTTDAIGKFTTARYDRDGLTVGQTDAEGNETLAVYDERGALVESRLPVGKDGSGTVSYRTTRYEYDQVGNRTKTITPRGVATTDDATDHTSETVYDELNRVKEERSPFDKDDARYNTPDSTFYFYDTVGNLSSVSAPPSDGQTVRNVTEYSYYDNGWTRTSKDPWDITTSYDYNELGQQTRNTLTSAGGSQQRTMTWDYYPSGNQKARSDDGVPVGRHVVLVDSSDFNNTATQGNWSRTQAEQQYGYDTYSHPAGTGADRFNWQLNIPQNGTYEVFVRHPKVTGAASDARFTVDHNGGSTTRTVDQTRDTGTWISLGSYSFVEDGPQKVSLSDQANGTVLADSVKLVRSNAGESDNEKKDFTYAYDANGFMVEVKDNSPGAKIDTYKIAYDGLNRIAKVEELATGTVKNTTALTYDENGNPLTSTHDLTWSKIDYDTRGLVSKVTNADSPTAGNQQITTMTYTARGQLLKQTKPNGNTLDLTYYLDGSVKQSVEKKSGGTVVAQHDLEYSPNGHRSKDVLKLMNADDNAAYINNTYTFDYDPQDRIAQVTKAGDSPGTEKYTYDRNSNVVEQTVSDLTTTHRYDRNRLLSSSAGGVTSTYNYDPLGRLDTVSTGGETTQKNYYDGFDRTVKTRAGTGAAAVTTAYVFDPFDRTVSQTTSGAESKTTAFTYLGMDNQVLREELNGKPDTDYQYLAGGQRATQIKHKDGGTKEYSHYVTSPRGDVEAITKEDGNTRATYGYTAYGSDDTSQMTGADKPDTADPDKDAYNAFRFNSSRWDKASGTYDMGFRNYDPGLNRFLTRDSYGGALADMALATDPFTGNRYAFAGGNPISFVELDGHLFGLSLSDIGHAALDVVGLIPVVGEVADVANGIWYAAEGNYVDAALSLSSAIPLVGYGASAVKAGKYAAKGAEALDTANDVRKAEDKVDDVADAATPPKPKADEPEAPAKPKDEPEPTTCPNSFVPGTKVVLADGSLKDIEALNVGDQVVATDPETGDTRPRTVTDTRDHRSGKDLVTLTVDPDGEDGAAKPGKITSTASHLFWLPDYGTWDEAADLESGMWLQTASGTWVQITAVDTSHRTERVHNLTVEGVHTYYVVAGGTSVLVHNCGPDAEDVANWVDEGGDLRATPPRPGMPPNAYNYQSGVAGARSNPATGRGMAPQLEMPGADGIPVTAKFDGVNGNEIIDRKLNPRFTEKAVDQARRQAATAVYNGLQAVWELPTADAVAAANRFMTYAGITTITVRMAP